MSFHVPSMLYTLHVSQPRTTPFDLERLGSTLHGLAFLIELEFLKGRDKLAGAPVFSVLRF